MSDKSIFFFIKYNVIIIFLKINKVVLHKSKECMNNSLHKLMFYKYKLMKWTKLGKLTLINRINNKPTAYCHIQWNVDLSVLNIHVYL